MTHPIDTVADLIAVLEDHDPDTPVRWAAQPAWPFEYTMSDVTAVGDGARTVVWLCEGDQVGYLPGDVSDALGWSA